MFILAYKEELEKGDLWWQIRALMELGWEKERDELLLKNAQNIKESQNLELKQLLAIAEGDIVEYERLEKQRTRTLRSVGGGVIIAVETDN